MRYELTDHEWSAIRPMLPNKVPSVPRVNDRRVLNAIFWCCDPAHRGATCRTASAHIMYNVCGWEGRRLELDYGGARRRL